ncbi:MAG: ABC transporter permease [Micrococcales bacterium]|nr:ABC transporter permease [Micrococcales bacterium]
MTTALAAPAAAPVTGRAAANGMAGLGTMVRLVYRRNRVRLLVWFYVLVVMYAYIAMYYKTLFPTQQSLDDFAATAGTPAIKAITGMAAAANTMGGAVWTKGWMAIVVTLALVVVFLVTRSGRADEEAGRTELLRSRMLGTHAYSVASWLVNLVLCVITGLGIAIVSIVAKLDPPGAGHMGSLVLGASVVGVGLVGLGVAAVAGQITTTSRAANSLGATVIVVLYVLRMAGDLSNGVLTWISPIGWGQHMQPYGVDRWWPFAMLVVLAALLLAVAWWLESRRDLGAGLLVDRPGEPAAPARYASPLGLALRLERNPIIGWTIGIVLAGLVFGSVARSMSTFMSDASQGTQELLRGSGVVAVVSLLVSMMALITLIFALQTTVSLRSDEASGIIEPQLAGAVSRWRWSLQRLAIPVVWSAVMLALGGLVTGLFYGASVHDMSQAVRLMGAALAYWPAVLVFVGLAVALWGWVPRVAIPIAWGVMAAMWFLTMFGEVFRLPQWFLNAMPLAATPYLPQAAMSWTPLAIMTVIAVVLGWLGIFRFSRRDITPA